MAKHPMRDIAAAHVADLRAQRAEDRRIAAEENRVETLAAANATAVAVFGEEAAASLDWQVRVTVLDASADLGDRMTLEYSPRPRNGLDVGSPGFLRLALRCSECGSIWSEPVESLEQLAFLLEDLPKQPVGIEATT